MNIAGREIGLGHPCYIVAELSGNHRGDFDQAVHLVEVAAAAGADAVKLQLYTPDSLTLDSDASPFRITWQGQERTLYDLYAEAATPWEWYADLKAIAERRGMACFASVFDKASVDYLEAHGCPAYKIASFELVDLPLIRYAANKGKPMILSTGMAWRDEIIEAVDACYASGNRDVVVLHCISAYPAPVNEMRLRDMVDAGEGLHVPFGLSDHSMFDTAPIMSVALGACMIEKHLTLRRSDGGPDRGFSLEPDEFAAMVRVVHVAEQSLSGDGRRSDLERDSLRYRRSLFVVADIAEGEPFSDANIRSIRPADGLPPKHLSTVLGRRAARDVMQGTPLSWGMVE